MRRRGVRRVRGGYEYFLTDEQLREWMATPAEAKLRWLAEAARFLWMATPPERREIREKVRRGEL
ncbi:MAG: hypothetical protein HYY17_01155 [Planctomycetes bacterium]|nr:hypothetical protein [Planctomycetota bacterium]